MFLNDHDVFTQCVYMEMFLLILRLLCDDIIEAKFISNGGQYD